MSGEKLILTIMSGAEDGKKFELSKMPIKIGRHPDKNDVVLSYDNRVSREHAKISKEGDEYWLEDLNSKTGTYINNVRVNERIQISSGNMILLGTVWVRFDIDQEK